MSDPQAIQGFHLQIKKWYQEFGRKDLPWRQTNDPYAILVSEIMLQQTQVQTVKERYYQPFLKTFPDLTSIASAKIDEVMNRWQGLGYYRRAKYLRELAKQCAPTLPKDPEALMRLPGIGKNTAHAVLAFAHHQPYPVMEANVKRVLSRIFAISTPKEKQLWQHAFELLDERSPYDYNQAMMDLGALICTPSDPKCSACPAALICKGKETPHAYPAPKKKKTVPIRQQQILVIEDAKGFIYSTPRTGTFLHGLHQFVEIDSSEEVVQLNDQRYSKTSWHYMGEVQQQYSHFKQKAAIYKIIYEGKHKKDHWYPKSKLSALPHSKKEEKILRLLSKKYPA